MRWLTASLRALCAICVSLPLCASAILAANEEKPAVKEKPAPAPEELSSKYYSIKLPKGWKVVSSPSEQQGNVNSIFSTDNGDCVITLIMGPTLGADASSIASMFSEEFKASSPPKLKDGEYVFSFPQDAASAQARVSVEGKVFKLITVYGNQKEASDFIANVIFPPKSDVKSPPADSALLQNDNEKAEAKSGEKDGATPEADDNKKDSAKAEVSAETKETRAKETEDKKEPAKTAKTSKDKEKSYSCQFYTVKLPAGWKAISPPEEQQGNINALFSSESGNASVALIVGPSLGADASSIASMFAEQFKASGKIKNRDGRYSFDFIQNGVPARAIVAVSQKEFMLATSHGDEKEVANFYQHALTSEDYPDLLPK